MQLKAGGTDEKFLQRLAIGLLKQVATRISKSNNFPIFAVVSNWWLGTGNLHIGGPYRQPAWQMQLTQLLPCVAKSTRIYGHLLPKTPHFVV